MSLSKEQIEFYRENVFLQIGSLLSKDLIATLKSEMKGLLLKDCQKRVLDKGGLAKSFFSLEEESIYFPDL